LKRFLAFALLVLVSLPPYAFAATGSQMVEVNGDTYEVRYDTTGLDVLLLDVDDAPPTLVVFVSTTGVTGTLTVTLEREFMDAKASDGSDEEFLVLLDGGIETAYTESASSLARILTISVPSGTLSVDIIGTHFGLAPIVSEPETPQEPPASEPPVEPEPQMPTMPEPVCGPGTVLRDGMCVAEVVTPPAEQPEPPMEESICGPGTVLKNGACVLDTSCGLGTIMVDGQCVLDTTSKPEPRKGMTFELVVPVITAFIIALIVMAILWGIGKAGRKKN
jgi:hypothetical protein